MRASTILALSAFSLALASTALAEETKPAPKSKVQVVDGGVIKGRKPPVGPSIDVARVVQKAPLPELRKPLLDRIGAAVEKDPF